MPMFTVWVKNCSAVTFGDISVSPTLILALLSHFLILYIHKKHFQLAAFYFDSVMKFYLWKPWNCNSVWKWLVFTVGLQRVRVGSVQERWTTIIVCYYYHCYYHIISLTAIQFVVVCLLSRQNEFVHNDILIMISWQWYLAVLFVTHWQWYLDICWWSCHDSGIWIMISWSAICL